MKTRKYNEMTTVMINPRDKQFIKKEKKIMKRN